MFEFEGKQVVAVKVPEYPIKPVSVRGRCFKRVNNSNRSMNSQEVAEMHLQSTGMSWDRFPAAGETIEDLDLEKVRNYIRKARAVGRKGFRSLFLKSTRASGLSSGKGFSMKIISGNLG